MVERLYTLSAADAHKLGQMFHWWDRNKNLIQHRYRRRNISPGTGTGRPMPDPLAWYPFNGSADDISGNDHDGSFNGGMNADYDVALFDDSDDYVDCGSDFIGTKAITFSGWIRPTGLTGYIVSNGKFYVNQSLVFSTIKVTSDGSTLLTSGNNAWVKHEYNHLAVTRTADGTMGIYVNGILSGSTGSGGTPEAGSGNVTLGAVPGGGTYFGGGMDDVRFYPAVLTAEQIKQVYEEGHTRRYLHANEIFGACKIFEVQSAAAGDAVYNCYEQTVDATEWDDTDGDHKFDDRNTTSVEVLNFAEFKSPAAYTAQLAAGDMLKAFRYIDDENNERWIGTPFKLEGQGLSVRRAFCKAAAGAAATIDVYLDTDGTGEEVNVSCDISGGGNLEDAIPQLTDGFPITVYKDIGGTWRCSSGFQAINKLKGFEIDGGKLAVDIDTDQLQFDGTGNLQTKIDQC